MGQTQKYIVKPIGIVNINTSIKCSIKIRVSVWGTYKIAAIDELCIEYYDEFYAIVVDVHDSHANR